MTLVGSEVRGVVVLTNAVVRSVAVNTGVENVGSVGAVGSVVG